MVSVNDVSGGDGKRVVMTRYWWQRSAAIAGFAVVAAALPLAVLAAPAERPTSLADCPIGLFWDPGRLICVPYVVDPIGVVDPILGPVGPVGVGGVGPVLGPVGPYGVGGLGPVLGPVGPVGVGRNVIGVGR